MTGWVSIGRLSRALGFGIALCAVGWLGWDRWVDRTVLPPVLAEVSVEMRDRHGALLRAFDVENGRLRLRVDAHAVDPQLTEMLLAYEDKRFWSHSGVDAWAMGRAFWQAIRHGRVVSGGSTLTMQVARLLENGPTRTVAGKLRQMRVAWALERRLSKAAILGLYLQHAPYGGRIEGVRSAALIWFGKEPTRLTPAEAALLVALPQAPEARRPDRHPDAARIARDRVLERMGLGPSAAQVPRVMRRVPRHAPHLADLLRQEAPYEVAFETTLDARVQRQVATLAQAHLQRHAAGVSAAVIVADHHSGEIRARLGAASYSDADGSLGFVDMARSPRSPGSTLKPLVYGLAFDRGLAHPETVMSDRPTQFGRYAPQNFDGAFRGDISARAALQQSLNVPVVALTEALGPTRLMAALRDFGTDPQLPGAAPAGLAISLGGLGMTLEELVTLYAGLAQLGHARPLKVLQSDVTTRTPVLAPRAAWQVGHVLSDIAAPSGTVGLAYKTGTSYGHRDAWAIGYDGQHVVGVWMGRPDGTPVPGAFGGEVAAPLLFDVFARLKTEPVPLAPPPSDTLIVGRSELPARLQRFGAQQTVVPRPEVLFPPDGARLATGDTVLKVRGGTLPLTVLLNGAPHVMQTRRREIAIGALGPGFSEIAVIDAKGYAAQVTVERP